jgi:hypothetical protein
MEISDDHTNQVYCRCSLCAEEGYGGAWISRNTRSRHMKRERTHRSKPFNSKSDSTDSGTMLIDDEYNGAEMQMEDFLRFVLNIQTQLQFITLLKI